MPTAVILVGAALLVLAALIASHRGRQLGADGCVGSGSYYTDGSADGDCADGGGGGGD